MEQRVRDLEIGEIIASLEDGLILRRATPADAEALVAFQAGVQREPGEEGPNPYIASWMQELMSGQHPTFHVSDFTVVATPDGQIVSALCLISQTWSFGGIPFGVGRIELVATHPDYRRRGLIRRQMGVVHQWSAERGELVQGITGIPWYYRQFGYEMALDLGAGRAGDRSQVPELAADATEPYRVRPATTDDLPFIASVDEQGRRRWLVSAVREAGHWRYELEGSPDPRYGVVLAAIDDQDGQPVGYLAHYGDLAESRLYVIAYELTPGVSWLAVTPSVFRYLRATGDAYAGRPDARPFHSISFSLGGDHPVYHALPDRLSRVNRPYAWYLRVPDLPAFLRHVAPVLETRLAASVACGHTGELLLSFFTSGLRLELTQGRLSALEPWMPPDVDSGGATFPGLSFLQLLFGYRSLAEVEQALPDCRANSEEARVLLTALFPKQPSRVWPID